MLASNADDLMKTLAKQTLRFGHDDLDKDEQKRHKCSEFYEEGLRSPQKMAVDTHVVSFLTVRRRRAYPHEFGCILVSRIESLGVQSDSYVRNGAKWMPVTILILPSSLALLILPLLMTSTSPQRGGVLLLNTYKQRKGS